MRYDSPFLVMRRAPMIGQPESKARIVVASQEYRLQDAIARAVRERARLLFSKQVWIERRGQPARRYR